LVDGKEIEGVLGSTREICLVSETGSTAQAASTPTGSVRSTTESHTPRGSTV
jgi:hypothetical protein